MKIIRLIKGLILLFTLLACVSIVFSLLVHYAKNQVIQIHELRRVLTVATHQISMSSTNLSGLARNYAMTGAAAQRDLFWEEYDSSRIISQPRRALEQQYISADEQLLLNRAFGIFDDLRDIEKTAVDLRSRGYAFSAQNMLFGVSGTDYLMLGVMLEEILEELNDDMMTRTYELAERAELSAYVFERLSVVSIVFLAASSVLGTFFTLGEVKLTIAREQKNQETNKKLIESVPLFMEFWDVDLNVTDCNKLALDTFGARSVEDFARRYYDFQPAEQPCGTPSKQKIEQYVRKAFEDGHARCDWVHILPNGQHIIVDSMFEYLEIKGKHMVVCYNHDLSKINAAAEKEREANELTQTIVASAPIIINLWDDSHNLISTSPQAVKMFGLKYQNEYIERFYELSPLTQPCGTASKLLAVRFMNEAFSNGSARFEWMHVTAQGEPLPMEVTLVHFRRQEKDMLVAYCSDLRQIKKSMEKEREALELTRIILDAAPFVINLWDDEYKLASTSRQAVDMFGLNSQDEYIEMLSEITPELQPCGTPSSEYGYYNLQKAFTEGYANFEFLQHNVKGEPLPTEVSLVRFKRDGKFMLVGFVKDMRMVKSAMEELVNAEERVKLLMSNSPVASWMRNSKLEVIDCNRALVEMLAKRGQGIPFYTDGDCPESCEECVRDGREDCYARIHLMENWTKTFPGYEGREDELMERLTRNTQIAVENGSHRLETEHMTFHGEIVPVEVIIVPTKHKEEVIYAYYLRDLRQEKRREIAEEESRAKTRFLARMSHEIRTPMNAVLGITEIQLQKDRLEPETEEAFLRIRSSSSLLLTIINDILDLSKVEAGKMEIVPAVYELASFIVDTAQLNLMHVGSKKIEFEMTVDPNLPTHFIGDELRLKQILNNLLSNAFKYTNEGLVTLAFGMDESDDEKDATLVITVTDTGQGMTPEQIDSLFEIEFTRFNIALNRSIEGSGLGMSIAYQLIKMMDGDIRVKSTPGVGSTFTIRIPQKPASDVALGQETVSRLQNLQVSQKALRRMTKIAREPMPYGRVLVADDVESNLYVVRGLLLPYKIAVETVESGVEAVDKIRNGEVYDIIFMDHMMPEMDGLEATKIIRAMGYEHPVVALTANTVKGAAELFMSNGFSGFIAKPIDVSQLNLCLLRFIRDKQPPEVIEAARAAKEYEANSGDGGGTPEIDSGLAAVFVRDAQKALRLLGDIMDNQMFDEATLELFIIQTHGMKSSLYNIGRKELSEKAHVLEQAGQSEDIHTIKNTAPAFLKSLKEIVNELSPPEDDEYDEQADGQDEPDEQDCPVSGFTVDAVNAINMLSDVVDRQAFNEKSLQAFNEQIIEIKGALFSIGKEELSETANILQRASQRQDTETIINIAPMFLRSLKETIKKLPPPPVRAAGKSAPKNTPNVKPNAKPNAKPNIQPNIQKEDTDFLRSQLAVIKEACDSYDIEEADGALAAIKQKKWSKQTTNLIDDIAAHMLRGEYEEAAELIT